MPMPRAAARPEVYRFGLEFFGTKGRRVHELALAPADFTRAVEATFFEGLRQGLFTDYAPPAAADAVLEPRFARPDGGTPAVEGFDVVLTASGGRELRRGFGSSFFAGLARRTGVELVQAGKVAQGGTVLYQLAAYLDHAEPERGDSWGMDLEAEAPEIPVRPGCRRQLGPTQAWDRPEPDEFPVVLPRHVIDEAVEEAARAPDREVGGVLLGHLRRDRDTAELYLEVTCLVPAEETEATNLSVTFTHATWARAREVVEVRGEGEIFVGWMHSHPFRFCAECPLPVPQECIDKVLFYSGEDEFLMELSFARPFMVGLLAAVEPRLEGALGHPPVRLFGWKDARIAARGFEVLDT
jgi:proteasome lid subunit RPN8/RPN11